MTVRVGIVVVSPVGLWNTMAACSVTALRRVLTRISTPRRSSSRWAKLANDGFISGRIARRFAAARCAGRSPAVAGRRGSRA